MAGATKELLLLAKLGNKAKSLPIPAGGLCVILDTTEKESQGLNPGLENLKPGINLEERHIYE